MFQIRIIQYYDFNYIKNICTHLHILYKAQLHKQLSEYYKVYTSDIEFYKDGNQFKKNTQKHYDANKDHFFKFFFKVLHINLILYLHSKPRKKAFPILTSKRIIRLIFSLLNDHLFTHHQQQKKPLTTTTKRMTPP